MSYETTTETDPSTRRRAGLGGSGAHGPGPGSAGRVERPGRRWDPAGRGRGPARPGPGAGPLRWLAQGAALLVVAGAASAAVQFLAARLPVPVSSNVPTAILTWGSVAALAVAAVLFAGPRMPGWLRHGGAAAVLAALATGLVAVPLHGTYYYLGGVSVDQQFRTQYLTRLTDSPVPADMNYADLAPFYPSGWFWLGGRVAALLSLPGWQAYKPLALLTLAIVPVAVYWSWNRLAGRRVGLVAGLVVVAAGLTEAATEPYSWAVGALLPGVAVLLWRCAGTGGRRRRARLAGVGAFLGLALSFYTLYAFFAALAFAVIAVWAAWSARPGGAGSGRRAVRAAVADLAVIAVPAGLVALPVWAPFLLAVLGGAGGANLAARYLPLGSAQLPTPMLDPTPWGALLAVGFGYALWQLLNRSGGDRDTAAPLGLLVVCSYGWYALSTLALGLDTTLLAFRIQTILVVSLGLAGVLGLRAAWRAARDRWPGVSWSGRSPASAMAGLVAVVVGAAVLGQNARSFDDQLSTAYTDPYPSGPNASGALLDDREERWSDALARTIARQTGRPADRLVVLTTNYALLAFQPYRGFQQATPHYANPLADYAQRNAWLADLATARDPAQFARRLDRSPWPAPSVFVLERADDGYRMRLRRDVFPATPNVAEDDVTFASAVFAGWSSTDVGPYTVLVRPGG